MQERAHFPSSLLGLLKKSRRITWLFSATLVGACQFTPLMNRIDVGQEPIVVFVAEGSDGSTDLFASSSAGGTVFQLTYNRPVESNPALAPGGVLLAFLRHPLRADSTGRELVVMNLANNNERRIALPESAGALMQLAWLEDGSAIILKTTTGIWRVNPPPAKPDPTHLDPEKSVAAETTLAVTLGKPVIAWAAECRSTPGICALVNGEEIQQLSEIGTAPFRWGTDSVAWFIDERIEVRPLGGGKTRQLIWSNPPSNPRQAAWARPLTDSPTTRETGLVPPR